MANMTLNISKSESLRVNILRHKRVDIIENSVACGKIKISGHKFEIKKLQSFHQILSSR